MSKEERLAMISSDDPLSIRKQSQLMGICRSRVYYRKILNDESEIANLVQEIYLASDCRYGYRKIHAELTHDKQLVVNRKRVLRIMQNMKIQGLYPRRKCNTSIGNKANEVFPYLLAGLTVTKADHVWATDITYIAIENRFMYFVAIIDLFSRYIISWELSPFLDAGFCIYVLKQALNQGKPEIFNTDQGSQFTSNDFTAELKSAGVRISMDHKGRCFDNIFVERLWRTLKQEAVFYYRPTNIKELHAAIENFVNWYNNQRRHQSLQYKRPAEVYRNKASMPEIIKPDES